MLIKKSLRVLFISFFILVLSALLYIFVPINTRDLHTPNTAPYADFAQSKAAIQQLLNQEGEELNSQCHSRLYDHGQATEKVVILLHGLTNCPKQFEDFGLNLYMRGYNVYIPRLPHHGLRDRLSKDLQNLTANEMIDFTSTTIANAAGLGQQTQLVGLSLGGVMAAWAAQEVPILNTAIIIAPNFGHNSNPIWSTAITRTALWLPNQFWWWDKHLRDQIPGPTYAYPQYSTRAVAHSFKLGWHIQILASQNAPRASNIVMITNENDDAVNQPLIDKLVNSWQAHENSQILHFRFPAEHNLGHDLIDPTQPYAKTDIVYPKLIEYL